MVQLWTGDGSPGTPSSRPETRIVVVTLGFVAALCLAWTGAWLLVAVLEERFGWPASNDARTLYWTVLRALLWVLPGTWLFRYSGIRVGEALRGNGVRSVLLWGVGAGALIGAEVVIRKWLGGQPYSLTFSWSLVSVVVVAPFAEEFVFRGSVLGSLLRRYPFGIANILASLLFVVAYLPGWYFTGVLTERLTQPLGGALSIFVLGLLFGFVVLKSRSVVGGMIAHGINNLFSVL